MSFAVNDKVEFVGEWTPRELIAAAAMSLTLPIKGVIYRVRSVQPCECGRRHCWLRLREIVNHLDPVCGEENAFCSSMFRPVFDTDISIFTALLTPSPVKETERV